MKKYVVAITDDALADMKALYTYIAVDLMAPDNSMGQYNRIAEAILMYGLEPLTEVVRPFGGNACEEAGTCHVQKQFFHAADYTTNDAVSIKHL